VHGLGEGLVSGALDADHFVLEKATGKLIEQEIVRKETQVEAAEHSGIEECHRVSPHQVSVQELADAANPLGATVAFDDSDKWLGAPLRVHRRCHSPMFDIANTIAYRNKMIQATDHHPVKEIGGIDPGESSWVDLGGRLNGRHLIPEQVALVAKTLEGWRSRCERPPLYIITPFREIRDALRQWLQKGGWSHSWCADHVGTVHTFQGKEQEMVWLVLGCAAERSGAARWAASKPNLLNVALTRARLRIFIIGERSLWCGLRHFSEACDRLPVIEAEDFRRRFSPPALLQESSQ
jgi:hypothetical protein